jgi:Zn-dependent protease
VTEPTATPSLERADDQPHEAPVEGTYIAPGGQAAGWKRAGSVAAGLGLLLTKAKTILAVLLGAKWFLIGAKLLGSSLSFVVSVWFYALFFGWKFAFVFTLLILVHECGHAIFMRAFGVPASLPYFIPGFGALITIKERPASVLAEAYIALGGPLVGSLAALACFAYGELTGEQFWIAAAYTGFFLNLFNLFPVMPLDGGRIAGAISPRIWLFGLGALVVTALWMHWYNPLIFILVLLSAPQAIAAFRGRIDQHYFALTATQRTGIALAYFGLAAALVAGMLAAHVWVPNQTAGGAYW